MQIRIESTDITAVIIRLKEKEKNFNIDIRTWRRYRSITLNNYIIKFNNNASTTITTKSTYGFFNYRRF